MIAPAIEGPIVLRSASSSRCKKPIHPRARTLVKVSETRCGSKRDERAIVSLQLEDSLVECGHKFFNQFHPDDHLFSFQNQTQWSSELEGFDQSVPLLITFFQIA